VANIGFLDENTPGHGVREFYREHGRQQERERIFKGAMNITTELADLYRLGMVERAEALLLAVIKGENK
jgi:hypothetical protein